MTPDTRPHQAKQRHPRSRARGVTLLECMIALLVLCIGGLGMARLQLALLVRSDELRASQNAARLAHQKIEQLSTGPLDTATEGHDAPAPTSNTAFERAWKVQPLPDSTGLAKISVAVNWLGRSGKPESAQLSTLAARVDPLTAASILLAPADPPSSRPTIPP